MSKPKACLILLSIFGILIILSALWLGIIALGAYSLLAEANPTASINTRDALDHELASARRIEYHGSRTEGDTLVLRVTLPRDDVVEFWECLTVIHRTVARHDPPEHWVTIEDTSGQRITVRSEDLRSYHFGSMTWERFRDSWQITNP